MPIKELHVRGYRSLRDVRLRPNSVMVLVGPNGCGKTNVYRALYWLSAAAQGRLAQVVVNEGGMPSALWAGERTQGPVQVRLRVTIDEFTYEVACGLPIPVKTKFRLDPEIKEETVWFHAKGKRTVLLERAAGTIRARDEDGMAVTFPLALSPSESALAELREPQRFPVLAMLRQEMMNWRFYHQFRTDRDSPIRRPRPGCRTPVLDHDGHDMAAALQTIWEIGDLPGMRAAVDRAFPGSELEIEASPVEAPALGIHLRLRQPGFQRPFGVEELPDRTIQYLCLVAALSSPRPPALLVLNEPETSIHPDLIGPLAELIVGASTRSQVIVTTHDRPLACHVERLSGVPPIALEKVDGATRVVPSAGEGEIGSSIPD